jgi:hypothetical protein
MGAPRDARLRGRGCPCGRGRGVGASIHTGAGRRAFQRVAQVTATIDIDTTHTTPLNPNFSGFNDEVVFPAEFFDYRLNNLAAQLSPGWVRYPSGLFSNAFNWQTGLMVPSWAAQFQGTNIATLLAEAVPWVNGKGGGSFVDAANRANFLNAKLIVSVNAFTDTPQSAGQMAAFAKANHIPVAVWELANEPYFYTGFFQSGADYVAKSEAVPRCHQSGGSQRRGRDLFMDAGDTTPNPAWDQSIAGYSDKYWDAVTYHHYPPQSTGDFSQWMADENAVLASKSSAYVTGYLAPLNPPGTKFLISEFLPSNDGLGTGTSVTDGTLYGAIYAAEYVMRMSGVPSMLYVGMHALTGTRGVNAANSHYIDVQNAYNQGTTIDTLTLNFGFFTEAQPLGLAVLNGVLRNATQVDSTAVTGGATVPATGLSPIPALYAQAYTSATGQHSVVVANKSATAQPATLRLNGRRLRARCRSSSSRVPIRPRSTRRRTRMPFRSRPRPRQTRSRCPLTAWCGWIWIPPRWRRWSAARAMPRVRWRRRKSCRCSDRAWPRRRPSRRCRCPPLSEEHRFRLPNGQPAFLFAVTPGQANVLVPAGLAAGPATVTVLHGSTAALTGSMTIASSAPGLYSANADGAGVAAANAYLVTASNQRVNQTACSPAIRPRPGVAWRRR